MFNYYIVCCVGNKINILVNILVDTVYYNKSS